jgi:hypothetical protein
MVVGPFFVWLPVKHHAQLGHAFVRILNIRNRELRGAESLLYEALSWKVLAGEKPRAPAATPAPSVLRAMTTVNHLPVPASISLS